ncbi:hypothetical protein HCI84_01270, partial [Escherichia coli]|nr:hypothetical protein [Escherichia coli]
NIEIAEKICPFSDSSTNETILGASLYGDKKFDKRVGYFDDIYIGYVVDNQDRLTSSSGGLTTWFAKKLLINKEVDAVIHVGHGTHMFDYIITENILDLDLQNNKKSRYYPVSFSELINKINQSDKKYLFIGIPCFVKSIRLAQKEGMVQNIKFVISLLCGHMKSKDFATSLAWQIGVKPDDLGSVDFRVKEDNKKANDYNIEVEDTCNKKYMHQSSSLFGTNWGLGFFKHHACDFCDDIAGELADATLGDAWLPKYINDSQGTNILIVRNDVLNKLLEQYQEEIVLETANVEDFYESQAGNFRNRREGLLVRVQNEKKWTPRKRLEIINSDIPLQRRKLYLVRQKLSEQSIKKFQIAKKIGSIYSFKLLMVPDIFRYKMIEKNLISALKETIRIVAPRKLVKIFKKR